MSATFTKPFSVWLYCLARQAERSVDFALHTAWDDFREYYFLERLAALEHAAGALRNMRTSDVRRRETSFGSALSLRYSPIRRVWANRSRTRWRFDANEVNFLSHTFDTAVGLARRHSRLPNDELVTLRMDLFACQRIIARKLAGLALLHEANRIEHYGQAAHLPGLKMEQIVGCDDMLIETRS